MTEVYRGVWVIAYRELLRYLQERSRLISSFAMPLLFLIMFGAGFSKVIGSLTPGVNFIQFMYPGIIAMTVLTTSMFSAVSIVWDREFGFLREVLVAPLSRTGVILGKAAGGMIIALVQAMALLILAPIVDVSLSIGLVLKLIPALLIVSFALSGIGILIAARMRSQQGFQLIMQVFLFPLIFLAGVFFPVNGVAVWLEVIAKINPVTYGVDAIRQIFLGGVVASPVGGDSVLGVTVFGHTMALWEDLAVVALFGVVLMSVAIWMFARQE